MLPRRKSQISQPITTDHNLVLTWLTEVYAENLKFRTEHVRLSLLLEPDVTLVNKMERNKKKSSRQRYRMKFAQKVQGKALQNVYFTKVADLKCYQ